jgi:thioredoxin reductase (NADPH)
LRYCAVCDGYEVSDQNLAVIGSGARGAKEAEFLRSYTDRVTLVPTLEQDGLDDDERLRLNSLGVQFADGPASEFTLTPQGLAVVIGDRRLIFDAVYPALGSVIHSKLAEGLGAALTGDGCIKVDAHQRSSVPGLYAAGDIVVGLDQISHAMGEAGVAATAVRNDLAARAPRLRADPRAGKCGDPASRGGLDG